jgi:putative RNA 2'-phosphotransferase
MIPYEFSAERFSRWMSYVLRHNPERYGLQPDRYGFVDFEEFLQIASRRYPDLGADRIRALIEASGTSRFEIAGERVRARYGHSIAVDPVGPPVEPPEALFFGTDASSADTIAAQGLIPADRRHLHLSTTPEEALTIAQRKTSNPMVFRILAQDAHKTGVAFFRESELFLTARVPPAFLVREPLPQSIGGTTPPGAPA